MLWKFAISLLLVVLLSAGAYAAHTLTGVEEQGAVSVRVTQRNEPPVHGVIAIGSAPAPPASALDKCLVWLDENSRVWTRDKEGHAVVIVAGPPVQDSNATLTRTCKYAIFRKEHGLLCLNVDEE